MKRFDGRADDELRPVAIRRGYLKYAEGSALVEAGDTHVLCSASVIDGVPSFRKGSGLGWVTAEYGMLPRATQDRNPRQAGGRTYEIQRLIGRALRSVVRMDLIGERTVWIDCDVLQADGGTRTAGITGAFVALVDALDYIRQLDHSEALAVSDFVAAVSVGIVDGRPMLDLTFEEDSRAAVDMNVVMTGSGRIVEVQGTAEKDPFTEEELKRLMDLARSGTASLVSSQREVLEGLVAGVDGG